MRIAVLTNAFPPNAQGGAGVIAERQVRLLCAHGHEVRVFLGDLSWTKRNVVVRLSHHLHDLGARQDLVQDVCAWNPDALITHNLTGCGFGTPRAIERACKTPIPWIQVLHDVQGFEPSGQCMDVSRVTVWQRVWSWARRRTMGAPTTVISPTQWLAHEYGRRGFFQGSQVRIIPNPAPERPLQKTSRLWNGTLLYVGRLTSDKGSSMIRALRLNGYNITCLDGVSHEDVLKAMEMHTALLVPSRIEENQPTVILDAFSRGLPVIASDVGGVRETVGEGGIVVPAEDVDAWKEAINRVYKDCELYTQFSREAWARFDPRAYIESVLTVLHLLLRV